MKKFTKEEIKEVKAAWAKYEKSARKSWQLYAKADRDFCEGHDIISKGKSLVEKGKKKVRASEETSRLAVNLWDVGNNSWCDALTKIGAEGKCIDDGIWKVEGIGTFIVE